MAGEAANRAELRAATLVQTSVQASVQTLVESARAGLPRAIGRLITMLESSPDGARAVAQGLAGLPRTAPVVGITGPPGVGKSTLVGALLRAERARDRRVAVVAVDPSSPFTGGALLGDRVRWAEFATDPGVFVRSMSARGRLGGLSAATPAAVDLMSALGFDLVVVETVGVGQNEVAVMDLADTVVVVTAPGTGDHVQAAKAGLLEIADILVVNQADREGAAATVRDLKATVALSRAGRSGPETWRVPVLMTTAVNGSGLAELVIVLDRHAAQFRRIRQRAEAELTALVADRLARLLAGSTGRAELSRLADRLTSDRGDLHTAADDLWQWIQHA